MTPSVLSCGLSLLPLALLVILLVWKKWPAVKAAGLTLGVCVLLSLTYFRCGATLLSYEALKGLWNALAILLVMFAALMLYEISRAAGAFEAMQNGLRRITAHELLLLLLLGYVFPSFLQGITGFGVAVAVGAPLLVSMGVRPLWAVVGVLLAHSWGGTFGTLGLAWNALMENAPQGLYAESALAAGILIWIVNIAGGLCFCWLYGKGKGVRQGFAAVACISLVHGGGQLILAQFSNTLACFLPTVLAFPVVLLLRRTRRYRCAWRLDDSPMMRRDAASAHKEVRVSFCRAIAPYCFLSVVALCCLLLPPVNAVLSGIAISFSFPAGETGLGYQTAAVESFSPFAPFLHPCFFLFLSCCFSCLIYRKTLSATAVGAALWRTLKKTASSGSAVLCFLLISKMMGCSGMIEILAQSFASLLGEAYPLIAPMIGLLGSFVTSSNMASNILFGRFQMTTATLLGQNAGVVMGAQTAGGAAGNAICPGNVVLGCASTDLQGNEGEVLKRVLPITAMTALLCGAVALFLVQIMK